MRDLGIYKGSFKGIHKGTIRDLGINKVSFKGIHKGTIRDLLGFRD